MILIITITTWLFLFPTPVSELLMAECVFSK